MAVLFTMPYQQFFDDDGAPLAGGFVYTYAAGSYSTPKAAYTTAAGDVELPNPIELDSSGRAVIFISGSYNYIVKDADGVTIRSVPNVTSFAAYTDTNEGFFQSFSGDSIETVFTLTDSLGTDEKSLMVFSELEYSTNGTFASDTGWTKGAGWTIAAGVATATGAISTAIEQTADITLIQGRVYQVKYTVTRSAGTITPSLGGTAGTARSAAGVYSEEIIAGSTQLITFNTSGFTGTLDTVSVRDVGGLTIRNPADYTLNGTSLTFINPPATGTGNIFVFAPYTLINAAGAAQTAADAAIAAQAGAEAAVNAVAYQFTFDSSTSMADPGTGDFRLNNATLASVTAIAVDALSSVAGNPDVSDGLAAWGASGSTNKGQIKITKSGEPATFALYNITAAVTDNTGWLQITVTHVASNGTFTAADVCYLQNARTGDVGSQGPTGTVSGASAGTMVTNDKVLFLDTSSADALSYDDPATIDLAIFGSGSATDGYVLTADGAGGSAFEAITGSGLVLISEQTASASTSIDFTTGINSTYEHYILEVIDLIPATDGTRVRLRTSTNGGSSYDAGASDYAYGSLSVFVDASPAPDGAGSTGATHIDLGGGNAGNAAGESFNAIIDIYNPAGTAVNKHFSFRGSQNESSTGELYLFYGAGSRLSTADIDALRIIQSSGNITSGKFKLYGVKKS